MYWLETWKFKNSIEREYKYAGKYGAKGEKRQKKKKPTPEQMKRQNQKNREKKMRRLIKENFSKGDLWTTHKYPKGTKITVEQAKKDMENFIVRLRRRYKKYGKELRYVYRVEIGKRGGIHIHMIVNRIWDAQTDAMIQECWAQGRVYYESLYEGGGFRKLAAYIVKQPDEEIEGQLALFGEKERKQLANYHASRNLKRPKPEKKLFARRTLRKIIENGPQPTKGYYIDKNTIESGVNPFTGMSWLRYEECRIAQDIDVFEKPEGRGNETSQSIRADVNQKSKATKRRNCVRAGDNDKEGASGSNERAAGREPDKK